MHRFTSMDENASVDCVAQMLFALTSIPYSGGQRSRDSRDCVLRTSCFFLQQTEMQQKLHCKFCSPWVAVFYSLSSKGMALPQPPGIFAAPFFNNFCFPGWSNDPHTLMFAYINNNIIVVITIAIIKYFYSTAYLQGTLVSY